MIKHTKKLQIFLMFLIACLFISGMTLLSLSSSINNKNETIQRLTDDLIAEQLLSSSLTDYDNVIIELQSKNDTLRRDLSITSETLVEKNLTINQLKEQLATERRKLARYKSSYNKNLKSRLANEKKKLNTQLDKERVALQSQENELEQQRVELEKLKNTPPPEKTVTAADQKAIDEERVEELMKKFDAYQVDLSVENQCDKDYLYRYNEAKSTLSHIRTYLQKNQMDSNYYHFVIANDTSITAQNRKLCLGD
ncbi:hypothetical protein EIJ81_17770 [Aliivibrio salmonicida]|uniref:Membrane protein n=1 Tax=Aliivibrio salmonicida (strain LFI1238) TaxID=316275 RepID=B6EQ53_ALISL|nr:hypothetical protein [Aliivibrio salmonicida]AZL86284.1 hypothetical protein EIJ81_17770 [Aliivibrio salmonicida]CAQ80820.1 membrane protein [Aliivibrio salmonicida LFI1238]